jgi:glycosyltransferase involved in cell wall biosynthesis
MSFEVTVVIPVRDGLPDVLDAVGSALGQTLPPAEVVLVDDASTDGSAFLVERRFPGRVRIVSGSFGSAAAARNAGLRAVTTEFVAFLDADDLWYPEKLAVASQRFAAAPAADWFFSDGAFRTIDGQLYSSWFAQCADLVEPWAGCPVEQLFDVNFVLTSSVVVRRSALLTVGGFDDQFTHGEDLDLWIRLSRRGIATASRRALVRYQHREAGLSSQVENRLRGGLRLFGALERDRTLSPRLRYLARRRSSLYHFKLGLHCLRAERRPEALREFAAVGRFPERLGSALLGAAVTLLPRSVFQHLRGFGPATAAASPLFAMPRVQLRGWVESAPTDRGHSAREERQ